MSDEPTRQYEDVYLWTPADRARLEELREGMASAIQNANAAGPKSMADDSSVEIRETATALDNFITEAKTRARVVRMVALPRRKWRDLKDAHPPRTETFTTKDAEGVEKVEERLNRVDEQQGFNVETIADELVDGCLSGFDTPGAQSDFLDDLSEPDFDSLYAAALRLNVGGFTPPKAEFFSRIDRIIGAISNSPDPSV